ncbi:MAG: hypothetical protein LAN63_11045 [Acidobacteriia bacterium]|nr:hypothetical protein [Terriglobia bacterium]
MQAAQEDPARFAEHYENNFERVYAFIARRVHDRDVAEDLTSDVFHKALANLAGLAQPQSPRPPTSPTATAALGFEIRSATSGTSRRTSRMFKKRR